jgi:hypothetical protein
VWIFRVSSFLQLITHLLSKTSTSSSSNVILRRVFSWMALSMAAHRWWSLIWQKLIFLHILFHATKLLSNKR